MMLTKFNEYLKFVVNIVGNFLTVVLEQFDLLLDGLEHVIVRVGLLSHGAQVAHHGD